MKAKTKPVKIISRPDSVLQWMAIFVILVGLFVAISFQALYQAFSANPWFNGVILGVLVIGILINFRQVLRLYPEIAWIRVFRQSDPSKRNPHKPKLLAPMSRMLTRGDQGQFSLSAMSLRSLLDSIRLRLDESRDLARYLTGLLIFMGLLGTFWGLLKTIGDASGIIQGLSVNDRDNTQMFGTLKEGLQGPLAGMAIAFSSSLFGLAGSLLLGFLDLLAGRAMNRFFNELEEWLSSVTKLSSGALPGDGEQPIPAYVQALLEQTADGLDRMQRAMSNQSVSDNTLHQQLASLNRHLADLGTQLQSQNISDELRNEMRLLNRTLAAAMQQRNVQ